MNNSNTYYQKKKKRLQKQAQTRYHQKKYYESNKKRLQEKHEINTENYLMKKRHKKIWKK